MSLPCRVQDVDLCDDMLGRIPVCKTPTVQRNCFGSFQVVTQALAFNESQRAVSNRAEGHAHKAKYKSMLEASKAKMSDVRTA
jgi:hypothetical protein